MFHIAGQEMSSVGSNGRLKDRNIFSRKIDTGREWNEGDVAQHAHGLEQFGKSIPCAGSARFLRASSTA